jgi:hypothetical protein
VVADLGGHRRHEPALERAEREGRGEHVEDAGAEAEDEPRTGRRDLQGGGDAEELGDALHHGAGKRDRRGRAGDGHRVDLDGHADARELHVDVEDAAVDLQWGGGGAHRGDARAGAEALQVARQRLAEAYDRLDLGRAVDEGDVLARLGEQREVLRELPLLERHVGCADLRPHDVEVRQLVVQGCSLAYVLQGAGAALTGAEVERLGNAAARREVERLAVGEQDVVRLGEAGHEDVSRALRERPLDQLAGQARDARGIVYRRASGRELRQDDGAGEPHAHAGQQLHRLVDDPGLLVIAQPRRARLHATISRS